MIVIGIILATVGLVMYLLRPHLSEKNEFENGAKVSSKAPTPLLMFTKGSSLFLLITGLLMILVGLSLIGKIKFLTLIEHSVSKSPIYQKTFKKLIRSNSLFSFYLLGMLNGLLPCGFVYFFAITAISTGSAFGGAIVMLIFGLSTIPALFSLGFFVGIFKQSGLRHIMIKLAAILVILYGVSIVYYGYEHIDADRKINIDKKIDTCDKVKVEEHCESGWFY